ncbi:hypothetical protein I2486_11485 [Cellulophaga sp. E16_2]|uniref:Peptidase E n=1 Tax=Cellulophaga algicola (strain DSM 14237 / IC166 / ACAM 630) TaxID=688270 RepID=E6X6P0_CELAD|nr:MULTISPECIES: DUF6702 family protein [Cellulophaga]ADV49578.1 hypothetical protein Celal_2286 [Cellulophaga algicola DSM 14237]MBO0592028.1 hypothetical protein [Cellulophaga sp. E16_2]
MKSLKKSFLILLVPLFAFTAVHKFYVTVTNIAYSEKEDAIQITSRIFIDDLEKAFKERYAIRSKMATENELKDVDAYIEKYIRSKFIVTINQKQREYTYIGKKYDNDVVVVYLEIPKVNYPEIKSISVTNEILTDMFEEQQNVVHFKLSGKKKSFVLTRENNKGMLNLD